ncbi:MAG: hypothetical protein ACHQ50_02530 [Fimbriimonadales bacterium]
MKTIRLAFSTLVLVGLAAGYLGSQFYALRGQAPEWARSVDTEPVAWIALLVLLGSVGLSLVREKP